MVDGFVSVVTLGRAGDASGLIDGTAEVCGGIGVVGAGREIEKNV